MKIRIIYIILALFFSQLLAYGEESRLSDKAIGLQLEDFPSRPAPILELGDPFLESGKINPGFELPTSAVWQPSFIIWGDFRTALQAVDKNIDRSGDRLTEWSNRFDLFTNLSFTSTERILFGFRPLDQQGRFTRYTFEAPENSNIEENNFEDEFNSNITTLFFEGDFGEIFPFLDTRDSFGLDFGFSVGRQQISWQDGMLINDRIDSLGISKINLKPSWAVNYRSTLLWGWNELNRENLAFDDRNSSLYGFSNEIELRETTAELDIVYVDGEKLAGDGIFSAAGFTQRIGSLNTTFRVLNSQTQGSQTDHNENGTLLFTELSKTLKGSDNFVYLDGFWGIDKFRSATRGPDTSGPLGGTGILFASSGLGGYAAGLNNKADSAVGSALGYQVFFNQKRQNLIFELAGRYGREEIGQRAVAVGIGFQTAIGQRNVIWIDTYAKYGKDRTDLDIMEVDAFGLGTRLEWQLKL